MQEVSFDKVIYRIKALCETEPKCKFIDPTMVAQKVCSRIYDKVSTKELDELAAQIANSTEEVEYIDGVSSIEEEDEEDASETKSGIESLNQDEPTTTKDKKSKKNGEKKEDEEEEVQVDTYRVIGIRRQQGQCLVRILASLMGIPNNCDERD